MHAIELARSRGAPVYGVVGRDGGFTKTASAACVVIPPTYSNHVTPHTEGLCALIWHLFVSHPQLARNATRWESLAPASGAA